MRNENCPIYMYVSEHCLRQGILLPVAVFEDLLSTDLCSFYRCVTLHLDCSFCLYMYDHYHIWWYL